MNCKPKILKIKKKLRKNNNKQKSYNKNYNSLMQNKIKPKHKLVDLGLIQKDCRRLILFKTKK